MPHSSTDDVAAAIAAAAASHGPAGDGSDQLGPLVKPLLDAYASADRRLTMARAAQFLASTPGDPAMENAFEAWLKAREEGDAAEGDRLVASIADVSPLLRVRVLVGRLLHGLGPWTAGRAQATDGES